MKQLKNILNVGLRLNIYLIDYLYKKMTILNNFIISIANL